jgi:hypothetical protein
MSCILILIVCKKHKMDLMPDEPEPRYSGKKKVLSFIIFSRHKMKVSLVSHKIINRGISLCYAAFPDNMKVRFQVLAATSVKMKYPDYTAQHPRRQPSSV